MKITLWQQFSSNHSGYYFIIGVFNSADSARQTEAELKALLRRIDVWHQQNPKAAQTTYPDPVPPEQEAAEQYQVEWPQTIDWTGWAFYEYQKDSLYSASARANAHIEYAFRVVQNVIFASNPDQTWMTVQPFKGLLEHFGAQTVGFDHDYFDRDDVEADWENWFFRVTCTAPDVITAEKLQTLPESLHLHSLTTDQNERHLTYTFQITDYITAGGLSAVLKSNACKDIQFELFKKNSS